MISPAEYDNLRVTRPADFVRSLVEDVDFLARSCRDGRIPPDLALHDDIERLRRAAYELDLALFSACVRGWRRAPETVHP